MATFDPKRDRSPQEQPRQPRRPRQASNAARANAGVRRPPSYETSSREAISREATSHGATSRGAAAHEATSREAASRSARAQRPASGQHRQAPSQSRSRNSFEDEGRARRNRPRDGAQGQRASGQAPKPNRSRSRSTSPGHQRGSATHAAGNQARLLNQDNGPLWTEGKPRPGRAAIDIEGNASAIRTYAPLVIALIVIIFLAVNIFNLVTYPNIYNGVKVGDVDLSGMTKDEAAQAISEAYNPRVEQTSIIVFAGDEGKAAYDSQDHSTDEIAEEISVEEANSSTTHWNVDCTTVGAYVNSSSLAEKAYQVGRDDGGVLSRIGSMILGTKVDVDVSFDTTLLEQLAKKIDATIGSERKDWNIVVNDGVATTTEGYDGYMVNRDTFAHELTSAFTSSTSDVKELTAHADFAPVRITESMAQETADDVNQSIENGLVCSYGSDTWSYDRTEVGSWIISTAVQEGNSWHLSTLVDAKLFSNDFYSEHKNTIDNTGLTVSFEIVDGSVVVNTNGDGTIPLISQAVNEINEKLFSDAASASGAPSVAIESGPVPSSLSLEDAIDQYVITAVSSYTTEFSTLSGTEARNSNIRTGAQYISNSICKADGGKWSFNELVGDTTPDKGYQAAGSIADGEYVDTYGGGICQVATTVFNAIYDSCYKVLERHPHSLYIASYPEGRDAAISWDDLDLVWQNDTSSDVLLVTSATESSVTVTLYSVPQSFTVKSEVGEWEEGEKYEITVKEDENLAKGVSYVKTRGTDGSKITVVRYVYDKNGNILYTNTFASEYEPKNEVIVCGPGTEVDTNRKDTDSTS